MPGCLGSRKPQRRQQPWLRHLRFWVYIAGYRGDNGKENGNYCSIIGYILGVSVGFTVLSLGFGLGLKVYVGFTVLGLGFKVWG